MSAEAGLTYEDGCSNLLDIFLRMLLRDGCSRASIRQCVQLQRIRNGGAFV